MYLKKNIPMVLESMGGGAPMGGETTIMCLIYVEVNLSRNQYTETKWVVNYYNAVHFRNIQ